MTAPMELLDPPRYKFSPSHMSGLQAWYDASRLQIGAAQFTAPNTEYLSVADHADLRMGDIDFWVAQWAYLDDASWAPLVGKWDVPQNEYLVARLANAPNTFVFYVRDAANTVDTALNATTFGVPPQRTWCFVLAWHDSVNNTLNIQINNGVVDSVAYALGLPVGASPLCIGNNGGASLPGRVAKAAFGKNPVGGIAGLISTISSRLYNSGAGLYHSQLTAAEATAWGLVSYWNLNENGGQRNDSTANVHHLTDNNTVSCAPSMTPETPADATLAYIWEDLSGNGYHAIQATETKKPVYKVNIMSGRPVVRFDGVDDLLRVGATNPLNTTVGTIFAVLVSDAGAGRVICSSSETSDALFAAVGIGNSTAAKLDAQSRVGTNDVVRGGTSVNDNTPRVLMAQSDGADYFLSVNGATETITVDNGSNSGAWFAANNQRDNITIGALKRLAGEENNLKADIAELLVYNRALSATEITRLSRYLGRRYGIAIS